VPHPGAIAIAMRTRRPILFGVALPSRAWRLQSWDRFEIPGPRAEIRIRYGVLASPDDRERGIADLVAGMEALRSTAPDATRG
jgi:lysophospholipid acyltransferase (LPLAT)-like uncharacterized protein